ncbi:hypothetical protein BST61_g1673 [Cercospora zeina]
MLHIPLRLPNFEARLPIRLRKAGSNHIGSVPSAHQLHACSPHAVAAAMQIAKWAVLRHAVSPDAQSWIYKAQ